jgi:hypothetical protein
MAEVGSDASRHACPMARQLGRIRSLEATLSLPTPVFLSHGVENRQTLMLGLHFRLAIERDGDRRTNANGTQADLRGRQSRFGRFRPDAAVRTFGTLIRSRPAVVRCLQAPIRPSQCTSAHR